MLTEDEQIAHADRGPPTITVAEFCKREGLDQKRLLGRMLVGSKYDMPVCAEDYRQDFTNKDIGSLLLLDNWQAARYAERNRVVVKSEDG